MLPRGQAFRVRLLFFSCVGVRLVAPLHGQAVATDPGSKTTAQTVLKIDARTVALDVVVTGKDGEPVQGLRAENFAIAEDGKPQSLTYFEEHTGRQVAATRPDPAAALPPNTFTNVPRVPPADSLTVLLLDSLNTPQDDQRFVHAQIVAFLKTVQPGRRMAIFTLGNHLRFVQGFSDDPAILEAALNNRTLGTNPKSSPLLQPDQEKHANQQTIANMQQYDPDGAHALSAFLAEQQIEQADVRAKLTLTAFQDLGHYLAGFPGRKNVVWFSGSFPLVIFPPPGRSIDYQRSNDEAVKKTDELLSAAQVAVYPVSARGVAASVIFDADHQAVTRQQIAVDAQQETSDRNTGDASMDQIAQDTGGIAIRNTNSLVNAVDRVLQHGTAYYTLTYTPTNGANDGRFRKIQLKLAGDERSKGVRLAYRQGYYAVDAKPPQKPAANASGIDPLRPLMDLGMPASTQVPLVVRVQRSRSDATVAGGNTALRGTRTRYVATFNLNANDLQFHASQDGSEHGRLEATVLVYSQEGRPLNWLVRAVNLDMDAARFARVQSTGIHFELEIDAPKEGLALRSGVYDLNAEKAGTLEISLDRIAAELPAASDLAAGTNDAPSTSLKPADNVSLRTTESAGVETVRPAAPAPAPAPSSDIIARDTARDEQQTGPHSALKRHSIAFWSQPAENVDPVLLHVPTDNESRYAHLRQDFKALHCTTEEMEEQPIPHKDGKNLVCTLRGQDTTIPIVVAARYDRRSRSWDADQRWGEALMLPLLFNALRAEPRQHTFVFVALDGEAGEKTFFSELRKKSVKMPSALVVLDALGLALPTIYTSDEADFSKRSRRRVEINRMLASEAMISAQVFRLPSPMPWVDNSMPGGRSLMQSAMESAPEGNKNWIIEREDEIPSILIYSAPQSSVSSPPRTLSFDAFHKDFEFVAYLLCGIDDRLAISKETAVSVRGKMPPEKR